MQKTKEHLSKDNIFMFDKYQNTLSATPYVLQGMPCEKNCLVISLKVYENVLLSLGNANLALKKQWEQVEKASLLLTQVQLFGVSKIQFG